MKKNNDEINMEFIKQSFHNFKKDSEYQTYLQIMKELRKK